MQDRQGAPGGPSRRKVQFVRNIFLECPICVRRPGSEEEFLSCSHGIVIRDFNSEPQSTTPVFAAGYHGCKEERRPTLDASMDAETNGYSIFRRFSINTLLLYDIRLL